MRIVAFAYACEPGKGSEPGAGWMLARLLARLGETWVITRTNNAPQIEKELPFIRERERLHFIYVDLPSWARSWKRGQRGVRLYYLLWQIAARRKVRELSKEIDFDLSWHLTLANAWLGSLAGLRGVPFVYGPVGGGVAMPWRLAPAFGFVGCLNEIARSIARVTGRFANPLARLAWRRATVILAQNRETAAWFPSRYSDKTRVFGHAMIEEISSPTPRSSRRSNRTAVFAGRLIPWKGIALAIRAIASLPNWRLVICGTGPDEGRLRSLAERSGAADRIDFVGLRTRTEVLRIMHASDLFLFPSLHDDSPFVVVEAVTCGLPVVCIDRGGPPLLSGSAGVAISPDRTAADVVQRLAEALRSELPPDGDVRARAAQLTPEARTEELRQILESSDLNFGRQFHKHRGRT